jgi:hypothetical protein
MIDTNQLLSIAFSLISQFANVVEIPPDHVPTSQKDIIKLTIGSPGSPLDTYLVTRRGESFWIWNGIVARYESPDSYYLSQNFEALSRLAGPATISSNQAIEKATQVMKRLAKAGKPLDGVTPQFKASQAENVHFYNVTWPVENSVHSAGLGEIEIDGRTGRVVFLQLWDRDFYDFAFAAEISNRVYKPEPVNDPKPPPYPVARMAEALQD